MADEIRYFVFKANIPVCDDSMLLDWSKNCQDKVPVGHGDYRWGKMLHDHLFVKNYKSMLEDLLKELRSLREELNELKKEKENEGLFKWYMKL